MRYVLPKSLTWWAGLAAILIGLLALALPEHGPLGELAGSNWQRLGDARADDLLGELERTADPAEQRRITVALEARFIAVAPAVTLFPNPLWGAFSTRRFTGFPDAANPYAKLAPHADPERLLVLTKLEAR